MIITKIHVYVLRSPLETPFAFSQGWVNQRCATLVEIETSEGITGWGEAFSQGLEPPEISAAVITHALAPLIVGKNPLDCEVLWHEMYHRTRDYGRKGSVMAAISAIDMALWDIMGTYFHVPCSQLMGGSFRSSVEPYATGFYRIHGQGEATRLADEAIRHHSNGYRFMKVKLGFGLDDDIAVMDAIRQALDGKDVTMMVDTNHGYGYREARKLGEYLSECNLRWYEEPLAPEDYKGYARLRGELNVAIAGGENEHGLYGFQQLFVHNAVDIAQPDLGSCGGLTALRHIITLAQAHGVSVNPHVWGSAVAQAASLQAIASVPHAHYQLFPLEPIFEFDQSDHPFRQDLVDHALVRNENGWLDIPIRPGLGLVINRDCLKHFTTASHTIGG